MIHSTRATSFLAAAALCAASCFGADADPALVAHFTFEEGPGGAVKDWSGNGNDGRNEGAEYVRRPDGTGYVLRFEDPQAKVDWATRPAST